MKNIITQYNDMVIHPYDINMTLSSDESPQLTFYGSLEKANTITFNDETYDDLFHKLMAKFNKYPIIEHKCHNCGGTVELDEDKHIFHCPYCNSVYAVGTNQIYS